MSTSAWHRLLCSISLSLCTVVSTWVKQVVFFLKHSFTIQLRLGMQPNLSWHLCLFCDLLSANWFATVATPLYHIIGLLCIPGGRGQLQCTPQLILLCFAASYMLVHRLHLCNIRSACNYSGHTPFLILVNQIIQTPTFLFFGNVCLTGWTACWYNYKHRSKHI